jgi:uncharacterized membrane protein
MPDTRTSFTMRRANAADAYRADRRTTWLLGSAAGATGLVAGLLYGFACAVLPGLARTDDRTFVDAMQQINVAIENPLFFLTFLGAPALTLAALVSVRRCTGRAGLRWVLVALAGTVVEFGVTAVVNIPLNNTLRDAGAPGAIADLAAVRRHFEDTWVLWNGVRTAAGAGACASLIGALVVQVRAAAGRAAA